MGLPAKIRFWGQYVQFIQNINWEYVAQRVKDAGYNGFVVHATSAWGALPKFWPWFYDEVAEKFNLGKPNPFYRTHVFNFLNEFVGKRKMVASVCLLDGYYTQDWANKGAAKPHPFRNNKNGINWSDDKLSLPESKPWFTHMSWKTTGDGFDERVTSYTIKPNFKWLWDYVRLWGEEVKKVKTQFPNSPTVLVRYINENYARFDEDGNHTGGFGGEDKLFQIVQKEWEKLGLIHGKDFIIVNDWMPFRGTEFLAEDWAKAGRFDRHQNHRWFREVHGCNAAMMTELDEMAVKYPQWAGRNFTVRSLDGDKPENNQYIPRNKKIFARPDRIIDVKVPSEPAVIGKQIYFGNNYMKTFDAVWPVMKAIAS